MRYSDPEWRLLWRRRGLGLDRSLPFFFKSEALVEEIVAKIPKAVEVPGCGRQALDGDDRDIIRRVAIRVLEYFAQHVPMVVTVADARKHTPGSVSNLVSREPGAEGDPVPGGSFDALFRVFSSRAGNLWTPYHLDECAVDVKITGSSVPLGLNGLTMRTYLAHGARVLSAAVREKTRLGRCRLVAYLLVRPAGESRDGKFRAAADGFVVFDATTFLQWKSNSPHPPTPLVRSGQLLVDGSGPSEVSLPPAVVAAPRIVRRDRWSILDSRAVSGKVCLQSFVETFGIAGADAKKAAYRAGKRLRDLGYQTPDNEPTGKGHRARKVARIVDLRSAYPEFTV